MTRRLEAGDEPPFSSRRIFGSASWATIQQVVTLGSTAVSGVILARTLSVEEFGVFSYATTLASMGMTIMTAGLSGLAIKGFLDRPDHQRWTMTALVIIRELAAAVAYTVLLLVSVSSGKSEIVTISAIALIVLFARSFDATEFWFQSRLESRKPAIVRIGTVLVFLAIRVGLALENASLFTFVILYVGESIVVSVGLVVRYRRAAGSPGFGAADPQTMRGLMGRSWILLLSGLAAQVNSRGDILVLQALRGSDDVGIYSAAARLSELSYFLPVVLMTAVFPALLSLRKRHGHTSAEYRRALQRAYDIACWGGVIAAVIVIIVGPVAIDVLFGRRYAASGSVLQIHVLALPLVSMAAVFSKWIVAENLLLSSLIRHSLGAALNIGLNFLLIPTLGVIGAAIATVCSYFLASYLSCFLGRRTREAGIQMTLAFAAPVRLILQQSARKKGPRP